MPCEYKGASRPRGKYQHNRAKDDTDGDNKVNGKRRNRRKCKKRPGEMV